MGNKYKDQLSERAKALSAELNEILGELAKPSARLPLEPVPNNRTIARYVTFVKHFTGSRPYRYVAVRPEGRATWSVSGRTSMVNLTWDKLMAFVIADEADEAQAAASVRQLIAGYNREDTGLYYADDEADSDEPEHINEMSFVTQPDGSLPIIHHTPYYEI